VFEMAGIFSVQGVNHYYEGRDFITHKNIDIVQFECGLWCWRSVRERRAYVRKHPGPDADTTSFDGDIFAWPIVDDLRRRSTITYLSCLVNRQ
jgi:hypothetical protein